MADRPRSLPCRPDVIERLRVLKGFSLEKLAARADIHMRTLERALKGKKILLDNIRNLATALNTSCESIIQGAPPSSDQTPIRTPFSLEMAVTGELASATDTVELSRMTPAVVQSLESAGITIRGHITKVELDNKPLQLDKRSITRFRVRTRLDHVCWIVVAVRQSRQAAVMALDDLHSTLLDGLEGITLSELSTLGEHVASGRGLDPSEFVWSQINSRYMRLLVYALESQDEPDTYEADAIELAEDLRKKYWLELPELD